MNSDDREFIEETLKTIDQNIVDFIAEDIEGAADEDFHDDDIRSAFRRFLEKDLES